MPDEAYADPSSGANDAQTGRDATPASGLVLVSTPIGNLRDMTPRGLTIFRAAALVLCEDTRVTSRLLAAHGISARLLALHEHNEEQRIETVLAALREGQLVALVSDAGTPLLSDPGYRLVRAAIAAGRPVGAVPGPNAALTALVLSGLPPHPFLFMGFPPPKVAARHAAFGRLRAAERAGLSATMIWHEAPHRVAESLADLAEAFGARPAALARELTKRFEEVRRGTLPELAAGCVADPPRGEITLVVGPGSEEAADAEELDARLRAALAGNSLKDAAALVATATGLPRKLVYARALELQA
jgi:16S rRNA (cytidine1402-2'-O)-methyltransferase